MHDHAAEFAIPEEQYFEWEKELWAQPWTDLAGIGWVFLWVLWRGWASKQEAAILPDCAAFE